MVKEHLNRDQKHVLDIFKMAAEVLEEIELKGERGNFTLYLSKEDVKGLEDVFIWTTPRIAASIDRKAILCLIDILSSPAFDKKLKDKKSKKKTLWKEIAEELNKRGFKLKTDDPGEKVHQKWRNMERKYRSFIEHKKKTGEGKKKQPEFFDELHKMLSVRHSVNPVTILDTTGSSSSLSLSSDKAVTPNKSSERKEGTADATSSLEPDCNNNKPKEKQSDTCATPYKRKHSLKSEKNEEVINLIKSMDEENKRSGERRFEREMQFFDSLQKEIANQHKERMNATYDLIDALKNNN